jgi:hypothetical protein
MGTRRIKSVASEIFGVMTTLVSSPVLSENPKFAILGISMGECRRILNPELLVELQ